MASVEETEVTISDEPVEGIFRRIDLNKFNFKNVNKPQVLLVEETNISQELAAKLVDNQVKVILNTKNAISPNYPSYGLSYLLANGVYYYEVGNLAELENIKDKSKVKVFENSLQVKNQVLKLGESLTDAKLANRLHSSTSRMVTNLEALSGSAIAYLESQLPTYLDDVGIPELEKKFRGKYALVCFPNFDKKHLKQIMPFIKEYKPTVIAVEEAADSLLASKLTPSLVLGRAEKCSSEVLQSAIPMVVPVDGNGEIPNENVIYDFREDNVIPMKVIGGVKDLALLLAGANVSELVVVLGEEDNLQKVLDNSQEHFLANMLLTKLKLGGKLVNSKGISSLYRTGISPVMVASFILVLFFTIILFLLLIKTDGDVLTNVVDNIRDWFTNLRK